MSDMNPLPSSYRSRIYRNYSSSRNQALATRRVDNLHHRGHLLRKIIRDHFPKDQNVSILDLGCGHGAFIYFMKEFGYGNIIGVDRSPEQVAEAQRLGIEGIREADLMEFLDTLQEASQDMVVAFDVIEHFTKAELILFVDQVNRVLRRGGKWIIHTPNAESPFGARSRYADFTHELSFTRRSISQLLLSSGFSDVVCYEDAPIFHGVKSAIRWMLWKIIKLVLRLYLAVETGFEYRESILSQHFLVVAIK